jgi:hypothetical protein
MFLPQPLGDAHLRPAALGEQAGQFLVAEGVGPFAVVGVVIPKASGLRTGRAACPTFTD